MRRAVALTALAAVMAVAAGAMSGCEGPAAIASIITGEGEKVKAQYTLQPRPTLILVDDPKDHFEGPHLTAVVAAAAALHLNEHQAAPPFVDPKVLNKVREDLGKQYFKTPIDEIGRKTGAEVVLYVEVQGVSPQLVGSLYRPIAGAQVKVIDVVNKQRLFPKTGPLVASDTVSGQQVSVQMDPISVESPTRATEQVVLRALAEALGLEVSQLFYDWREKDMGDML